MQKKPIIIISIIILLSLAIIFQDLLSQIPENDNEEKQVIPPAIEWGEEYSGRSIGPLIEEYCKVVDDQKKFNNLLDEIKKWDGKTLKKIEISDDTT